MEMYSSEVGVYIQTRDVLQAKRWLLLQSPSSRSHSSCKYEDLGRSGAGKVGVTGEKEINIIITMQQYGSTYVCIH